MPWLALTVEVDGAQAEPLSEALLELGAESVAIERPDSASQSLRAVLKPDADAAALLCRAARSCGLAPAPRFSVSALEDDDWVRRSQAQFAPLQVGGRLWIGQSWHAPPPHVPAALRLDPGLAFGTGSHASTRLVLGFLARALRGGESVLDYGCGSGILAIAAAKLGAVRVDAVDLDPQALEVTATNARANGVAVRVAAPEALPAARYDVVLANILAQPLMLLAPLLATHTAGGGKLALSGMLESQATEVARAYDGSFDMRVAEVEEGWALLEGLRR
ncbi:MAG: 50S ribosomal protein L11 methyltransferase [Betaproteobacteria bacterium]